MLLLVTDKTIYGQFWGVSWWGWNKQFRSQSCCFRPR